MLVEICRAFFFVFLFLLIIVQSCSMGIPDEKQISENGVNMGPLTQNITAYMW